MMLTGQKEIDIIINKYNKFEKEPAKYSALEYLEHMRDMLWVFTRQIIELQKQIEEIKKGGGVS
jgi:hypothetical protein